MQAVRDATQAALYSAKDTTLFKDKTGALRGSIRQWDSGAFSGQVLAGTPAVKHATFMENGTRPHVIKARRAPFLVFRVNGVLVRAKQVNHPGTAKRPFMANARRDGAIALSLSLHERVAQAMQR